MSCKPLVVHVQGVAPDAVGVVRMRTVAFRAHCGCGHLGAKRKNFFTARSDAQAHRKAASAS